MEYKDLDNINEILQNKKIALFTVNKDTINFLKMYKTHNVEFEIVAVCDITLPYREEIKNIYDSNNFDIPLLTDLADFMQIKENVDIIIKFDLVLDDYHFLKNTEQYDSELFDPEEFQESVKSDFENVILNRENADSFTYAIPLRFQSFLNNYLLWNTECTLIHYYGESLIISLDKSSELTEAEQKEIALSRTLYFKYDCNKYITEDENINFYEIARKQIRAIKPVFVISSDFGAGKTSYILQNLNNNWLNDDLYTAFFDIDYYYGTGAKGIYQSDKGKLLTQTIHEKLCQLYYRDASLNEIFIKISGDIDNWIFKHIQGINLVNDWSFYHDYFNDYEFHIIVKENEDKIALNKKINIFCKIHNVDPKRIKFIEAVNYASSFIQYDFHEYFRE